MNSTSMPKPQSGYPHNTEQGQHQGLGNRESLTADTWSAYDDRLSSAETLIAGRGKLSLQLLWQPRRPWGTQTICPSTSFQPSPLLQTRSTGFYIWYPASSFIFLRLTSPSKGAKFLVRTMTYHRMSRLLGKLGDYSPGHWTCRIDGIWSWRTGKTVQIWEKIRIFLYCIPRFHYPLRFDQEKKRLFWI